MAQGWSLQPPGPEEAGPSNWVERNLDMVPLDSHFGTHLGDAALMADNFEESPPELQNISNIITNRFRISPPMYADIFNPFLQASIGHDLERGIPTTEELYSPTFPL